MVATKVCRLVSEEPSAQRQTRASMGCSRAGATAVACVLVASVVSIVSLVLPYWSKMSLILASNDRLELTFGLWGSCVQLHPSSATKIDAPVITNGTEVIAIEAESDASNSFTCGSYYDPEMIRIRCTSFRELATGQCKRKEFIADGTLCKPDTATDFLNDTVDDSVTDRWLRFLSKACGGTGRASITFALLATVSASLSVVLLFFGITCAAIESCLGRLGGWCASMSAVFQTILALLWASEIRPMDNSTVAFATSFYLNVISVCLHSVAFVAARKHRLLEKEAHAKLDMPVEMEKHSMGNEAGANRKLDGLIAV